MEKLNLPDAGLSLKSSGNKSLVFDIVRKKWVTLTPEEWVRQHVIHYLADYKHYPKSLMQVEREMTWNRMRLRTDILVFDTRGMPLLLVECKAPEVALTETVFEQIATYNRRYEVPYLLVTNGKTHYCCTLDYELKKYTFLREIPDYLQLTK